MHEYRRESDTESAQEHLLYNRIALGERALALLGQDSGDRAVREVLILELLAARLALAVMSADRHHVVH